MFRKTADLQASLDHVLESPKDEGTVEFAQIRPAKGKREARESVHLSTEEGAQGDRWILTAPRDRETGEIWREMQVTLMNARMIEAIAGDRDNWPPAGDQFFVDFDLSAENLPAGTHIGIGTAVLEVSAEPHLGCDRFIERYGIDACRFVNSREGKALRLRGVNCRIVRDGEVRSGDRLRRIDT